MKARFLPLLVSGLAVLLAPVALAQERMARVDIASYSKDQIELEVVAASDGVIHNHGESGGRHLYIHVPATKSWQTASIKIFPSASGQITIDLMGPYIVLDPQTRALKPVFIHYDEVKFDTVRVMNGGFERMESGERPASWYPVNVGKSNPPLAPHLLASVRTGDAAEGENYLRVWHNSRVGQLIKVEGGVAFTLTFQYRLEP